MHDVDLLEQLEAFIGVLLNSATFKSYHQHFRSLFATDGGGRDIFCLMTVRNIYASASTFRIW